MRSRLAALLRWCARAAARTAGRLDARVEPEPVIPPGAPEHWLREVERRAPQLLRGGGLRAGGVPPGAGVARKPARPAAAVTPTTRPAKTRRDFPEVAASRGPRDSDFPEVVASGGPGDSDFPEVVASGGPGDSDFPEVVASGGPGDSDFPEVATGRTVQTIQSAPTLTFPSRDMPSTSPPVPTSSDGRVPDTTVPARPAVIFPAAPVAVRDPGGPPEVPAKSPWPALPPDAPLWTVPAGAWTAERIRMLDAEQAGR